MSPQRLISLICLLFACVTSLDAAQPNVIYILADDLGYGDLSCYGAHDFETPDAVTGAELAKKPALALWGEADRTLHAEHFLPLFSQAFPNGHIHRLPGAGHYSPEDAPEAVARLVAEFVATSSGAQATPSEGGLDARPAAA